MAKKESVSTQWLGNMAFESEINGHKLIIDADPSVGGEDRGPRPKLLMLSALGGCTAMDIVAILKKMRVDIEGLNVIVEGDLTEEHPRHFSKICCGGTVKDFLHTVIILLAHSATFPSKFGLTSSPLFCCQSSATVFQSTVLSSSSPAIKS